MLGYLLAPVSTNVDPHNLMVLFSALAVINTLTKSNLGTTGMEAWPGRRGSMSLSHKNSLWAAGRLRPSLGHLTPWLPCMPGDWSHHLGHGVTPAVVAPRAAHPAGGRGVPAAAHGLCVGTRYQLPAVWPARAARCTTAWNSRRSRPQHMLPNWKTTPNMSNKRTSERKARSCSVSLKDICGPPL